MLFLGHKILSILSNQISRGKNSIDWEARGHHGPTYSLGWIEGPDSSPAPSALLSSSPPPAYLLPPTHPDSYLLCI